MQGVFKSLLLAAAVLLVVACGDPEPELSDAERDALLRKGDREMADAQVPKIPAPGEVPADLAARLSEPIDLTTHPLSRFFVPEGAVALDALGKFYFLCDPEHPHMKQECETRIEEAIILTAAKGITLTRADLLDPNYWAAHRHVYALAKAARAEARAAAPKNNFGLPRNDHMNKWNKEFRKTQYQLMDELCGWCRIDKM